VADIARRADDGDEVLHDSSSLADRFSMASARDPTRVRPGARSTGRIKVG
jgi:hypothetical protein